MTDLSPLHSLPTELIILIAKAVRRLDTNRFEEDDEQSLASFASVNRRIRWCTLPLLLYNEVRIHGFYSNKAAQKMEALSKPSVARQIQKLAIPTATIMDKVSLMEAINFMRANDKSSARAVVDRVAISYASFLGNWLPACSRYIKTLEVVGATYKQWDLQLEDPARGWDGPSKRWGHMNDDVVHQIVWSYIGTVFFRTIFTAVSALNWPKLRTLRITEWMVSSFRAFESCVAGSPALREKLRNVREVFLEPKRSRYDRRSQLTIANLSTSFGSAEALTLGFTKHKMSGDFLRVSFVGGVSGKLTYLKLSRVPVAGLLGVLQSERSLQAIDLSRVALYLPLRRTQTHTRVYDAWSDVFEACTGMPSLSSVSFDRLRYDHHKDWSCAYCTKCSRQYKGSTLATERPEDVIQLELLLRQLNYRRQKQVFTGDWVVGCKKDSIENVVEECGFTLRLIPGECKRINWHSSLFGLEGPEWDDESEEESDYSEWDWERHI